MWYDSGRYDLSGYDVGAFVDYPPSASFTAVPVTGIVPLNVQFTDTSGDTPTSWLWYFGDGETSPLQDPNHLYAAPGTYTVFLIATNAYGSSTSASQTITVSNPIPEFSVSTNSGASPLVVQFTDITGCSLITAWSWDFGDGYLDTVQNPVHTYSIPGTYSVTLTLSFISGASTSSTYHSIFVSAHAPVPAISHALKSRYLEVFDSSMVRVAVVDDFEYLQWQRNWYEPDTWQVRINRYKNNTNQFAIGGFVGFKREGTYRIGMIEKFELPLTKDGKISEQFTISGRGIEALVGHRIALAYTATGTGYDATTTTVVPTITFTFAASVTVTATANCSAYVKAGSFIFNSTNDAPTSAIKVASVSSDGLTITLVSTYAGTAGSGKAASLVGWFPETTLKYYVNDNCIAAKDGAGSSASNRVIAGLSLATDQKRGTIAAYQARFQNLLDIHSDILRAAGLSWGLTWSGTGANFVYDILAGNDKSSTVKISPEFGNVQTLKYLNTVQEMKNVVYMLGAGTANTRSVTEVYNTVSEPTSWDRRETYQDASDLSTAFELTQNGNAILQSLAQETTIDVVYLPYSHSFYYEAGLVVGDPYFDLGDTVTVDYPGISTVAQRIIGVTEEYVVTSGAQEQKEVITLTIGKDKPNFPRVIRTIKTQYSASMRK